MIKTEIYKPDYLKVLGYIISGSIVLYFGSSILIPIAYAVFITFVLYPITEWLEKHKFPRSVAIGLSLMILLIIVGAVIWLLVSQAIGFFKQWPMISGRFDGIINDFGAFLNGKFGISADQFDKYMDDMVNKIGTNVIPAIGSTLASSASGAIRLFLIPVYASLILYNRERLTAFLYHFVSKDKKVDVKAILHEAIYTFYRFIKGMLTVYIIVGILNSIGLYFLGVPNAILFGFIASILTFIPYIGILIGAILPVTIAWAVHDNVWYGVAVAGVFAFVQILEANLIFPIAVSYRLKVSTLFTIIAIFVGGLLWGVSGMILFIPGLGILRLILDKIPDLRPIAKLLE